MTNTPSDDFYGTNRLSREQGKKGLKVLSADEPEAIRVGCAKHNTGIYKGF